MRLRVEMNRDATTWFGDEPLESDIQNVVDKLEDNVIFVTPATSHKQLLTALGQADSMSARVTEIILTLLQIVPQVWTRSESAADIRIGDGFPGRSDLPTALRDDAVRVMFRERKRVLLQQGQRTNDAYDASLGIVAGLARSVHILDRYAATDLMRTSWLFARLLKYEDLPISIWTELPTRDKSDEELLRGVSRSVKRHLDQSRYRADLQVSVFPKAEPWLRHPRRIKFEFDFGALSVELDKGLATFVAESVPATLEMTSKSMAEFVQMKTEWLNAGEPPVTFKWQGRVEARDSFGVRGGTFNNQFISGR